MLSVVMTHGHIYHQLLPVVLSMCIYVKKGMHAQACNTLQGSIGKSLDIYYKTNLETTLHVYV